MLYILCSLKFKKVNKIESLSTSLCERETEVAGQTRLAWATRLSYSMCDIAERKFTERVKFSYRTLVMVKHKGGLY